MGGVDCVGTYRINIRNKKMLASSSGKKYTQSLGVKLFRCTCRGLQIHPKVWEDRLLHQASQEYLRRSALCWKNCGVCFPGLKPAVRQLSPDDILTLEDLSRSFRGLSDGSSATITTPQKLYKWRPGRTGQIQSGLAPSQRSGVHNSSKLPFSPRAHSVVQPRATVNSPPPCRPCIHHFITSPKLGSPQTVFRCFSFPLEPISETINAAIHSTPSHNDSIEMSNEHENTSAGKVIYCRSVVRRPVIFNSA
ncbi:hypothetical protein PR048_014868 [Dryococelus australis]|uniref:Uncharacterized protein n=1 Tax=Dryococelus australis TaxID=614101 RepID=A0ABQ9HFI9_9NEOP|nr:hypothetical protein PR048_014868 [Dryococelus australis]